MAKEELTRFEKAGLLAYKDFLNRDDYDRELYGLLRTRKILKLSELDDAIRLAIVHFIEAFFESQKDLLVTPGSNQENLIKGALTVSLLIGCEAGRKLRRPLTAKRVRK